MTNIINFPDLSEASADWHPFDNFDDGDPEPITEEILVEFFIAHGITCAGELDDLSQFLKMLRGHPFIPDPH